MTDPTDFSFFENAIQQQQQQRNPADRNLNLRFYTEATENKAKSLAEGRPIYDNIDYVEINVAGSRDTVVQKMGEAQKKRFGPQYEMWKKTQEQPIEGTDLAVVPFLNAAQIKEFKAMNVLTLEQLADISDAAVQRLGMGALEARKKAQTYMKAAKDSALTQRLHNENETLKRDLAATQKQVAELSQRLEAVIGSAPVPNLGNTADVAAIIREEVMKTIKAMQQ